VPVEARHVCLLFRRYMSWRGWRQEDMTRAYTRALEARGIDHLLIGARTFHHREEVETLRAALTAVEWPDDELSVFATLSGSLFALRDDTLLRFGEAYGFHPLRFRSKASSETGAPTSEPAGGIGDLAALDPGLQAVGEALDLLARLHRRRNRRAIVETLSELLQHTRAHAGFALRPAGHQVLGNVERVLDLARAYEFASSRPVSLTSLTVGTIRQISTNVSLDGAFVAGSISRMFGGSGNVIRIRPFWRRLRKSLAATPFVRKSSASIGRKSGSSAWGSNWRRHWSS
jgi:hypothetical protein